MKRVKTDFRFLFFALIIMSLVGPLLGPWLSKRGILELTFTAVLFATVARTTRGRIQVIISLLLGSLALVSLLADRFLDAGFLPITQSLLVAAFLAYTAALVLASILSTRGITSHEVFGALSVYLLLGMTWVFFYTICLQYDPGAIRFPEGGGPAEQALKGAGDTVEALIYFSFVTLTTLGYGDIQPVSRMARTLAWMEAACGQIFLAVLVARLIGLMDRARHREPS